MEMERMKGRVKWFNARKGFGFIEADDGQDVFCHYSAISGRGYRHLEEGDVVEFHVEQSPKGLVARDVKRISTRFANIQRNP